MFPLPSGVTATVSRPAGMDAHGNPLAAPAPHTVAGCGRAPAGSLEQHFLESTVEWDVDLLAPHGADIKAQDTVTLTGDTTRYQVHGLPAAWRNPFTGWNAGTVVRLKAVEG